MYRIFKRLIDIFISMICLLIFSPVFCIITVAILINMGRPVFFVQQRTTKKEKLFNLYKFRTMKQKREYETDELRITPLGELLRGSSLDELPEFVNVLKGDMSIVGPRPLLPSYKDFYYPEERKRFYVKGGLIPPEILYMNIKPSWDEQLQYESEYAINVSFIKDIRILLLLIIGLFKRKNDNYGEYVRDSLEKRGGNK